MPPRCDAAPLGPQPKVFASSGRLPAGPAGLLAQGHRLDVGAAGLERELSPARLPPNITILTLAMMMARHPHSAVRGIPVPPCAPLPGDLLCLQPSPPKFSTARDVRQGSWKVWLKWRLQLRPFVAHSLRIFQDLNADRVCAGIKHWELWTAANSFKQSVALGLCK
uniref:Uncharacterized protein n=1 Tax=Sphaerodactylus townsendi TaxID=933632 RepID=A0ACB8F8I7_9SAUR